MQEKLLWHVAEEMTSLSNIFKATEKQQKSVQKRTISIRNLHQPSEEFEVPTVDFTDEKKRMLQEVEAKTMLEQQRIEDMRRHASEELDALRAHWEEEKVELQKEAYDEGFQAGFEEGRNKALADMADSVAQANDITNMSKQLAEEYHESQERVVLEIAMRTASRILHKELENPENFLSVVKRALVEVREMKEVKLYVAVDDYEFIAKNKSELAAIFPPDTPFLIFANEDFDSTECYIETNHGRIVVTVDEQLTQIKEALIEVLESED